MLTDSQVKNLKPKEKRYSVTDGEGLSIDILPTGKKSWVLSYRIDNKQTRKSFGEYPTIGCKEARQLARQFKNEISDKKINIPTVKKVCDEWLLLMSPQWTNAKYTETVIYRLKYITQDFEHQSIDEITRRQVSTKVKEIVAKGTLETATRSLRLLNTVFNFAIASDYTEKNPCILVDDLIPEHEVNHYPCLPSSQMPEFFKRLKAHKTNDMIKTIIMLVCYTGVRISELLKARWDTNEFNFESKIWTIPATRMKRRKELMVYLAPQVFEIFKKLYDNRSDNGYLFKKKGAIDEYITSVKPLTAIKKIGYENEMVTHGFRSLFSTHANESKKFRVEVIDYQIAHVNKSTKQDKTSKIYNRAAYWDERVELMTWYANEVEKWIVN